MGCCCCRQNEIELPEKYEEDRSCTDIAFMIVFIVFLVAFGLLGVMAFKTGNVKTVIYGTDYLGYACGSGDGPPNFPNLVPTDAPFQSQKWKENNHIWYPLPMVTHLTDFVHMKHYLSLGICVKTCPQTNKEGLEDLLKNNTNGVGLKKMQLFSYGDTSINGIKVNSPSQIYALYDTSKLLHKCLPKLIQPVEVRRQLPVPYLEEAYSFFLQGVNEVTNSWRVIGIEAGICILSCFIFVVVMRFCVKVIVWIIIFSIFFLLAGGGGVSFFLYQTKGESAYLHVTGIQGYSVLFLVIALILWFLAICYMFIVLALCMKIRLVCSIIQIAGRVLGSAPTMLILPFTTTVAVASVAFYALLVGLCFYSAKDSKIGFSLVPVTDALQYTGAPVEVVNNTKFFKVASQAFENKYPAGYWLLADLFGFLWTVGFFNAVCFTTIAFVAIFWYYSSLSDTEKSVPACGVGKALGWTLFYHTGTLALGSFLIAIIQTIRFVLAYFAKKARSTMQDNSMIRCLICYMHCFVAYFERVVSVINTNAYVFMCLTSQCFCISACNAIRFIMSYAIELLFLSWFINVLFFFGKLFIVGGCCASAYFLCHVDGLAKDIEVYVMPLIVVGALAFCLSSAFFSVYESTAVALLLCYCYDLKSNASRGLYYVPEELEHQIAAYSQREKLRQFNAQQAALHRGDED